MIVVRITGGLGNQLFQYATGFALAQKFECELVLDTSFYPTQTLRKYELDKFNIQARIATKSEIKKLGGGQDFISKLIRKIGGTQFIFPNYFKETESIVYHQGIEQCVKGTYLDGYWQNPKYFSKYKKEIVKQFTPIEDVSVQAKQWEETILNNKMKSVSLHVRRGDYVQNAHTNSIHGTCDIDYYKRAVAETKNKHGNDAYFFVFSDDIDWCKENLNGLGKMIYVDDTQSAIDDLYLMSKCNGNIIANSTFSWWGAWLNNQVDVFAPVNWFVSQNRNSIELYPKEWNTL
jgi:hypothetical protein